MSGDNNKRIAKNTAFLYLRMILVLLVGLYTSRVVLNVLGVADYGVYNVVAGFVSLFSFFNATLTSSLQRFYNYEGGRFGEQGFVRVYSIGIWVHLILAGIIFLLLETFGIWYLNNVIVLPEGRLETANYLFQFSVLSMMLVIIQIPFSSAIVANERMNFYAFISIFEVLARLVIVFLLTLTRYDKLLIYGFLQLCVTGIDFIITTIYTKTSFRYLKLTRKIDISLLKEVMSFSGWNLLGTVVFMLKGQGVNLLLNAFFGTIVNAARGVAFQVNSAISGFSSNISVAFRPQMVSSYATGDNRRTFNLFLSQSKLCYCLILMLITPVIIEIDEILHLWLGEAVPENSNIFTALVLIDAMICTLNTPVTQIVFATGNIRMYQILTSLINILLLPSCWLFLKMGYDAWITFLITIIVSILNQIIALFAMHRVFNYSSKDYFKSIVLPCFSMTLLVPVLPYLITFIMPESFWRVIVIGVVSVIMTVSLLYLVFLSPSEKDIAHQYIQKTIKKKEQ